MSFNQSNLGTGERELLKDYHILIQFLESSSNALDYYNPRLCINYKERFHHPDEIIINNFGVRNPKTEELSDGELLTLERAVRGLEYSVKNSYLLSAHKLLEVIECNPLIEKISDEARILFKRYKGIDYKYLFENFTDHISDGLSNEEHNSLQTYFQETSIHQAVIDDLENFLTRIQNEAVQFKNDELQEILGTTNESIGLCIMAAGFPVILLQENLDVESLILMSMYSMIAISLFTGTKIYRWHKKKKIEKEYNAQEKRIEELRI